MPEALSVWNKLARFQFAKIQTRSSMFSTEADLFNIFRGKLCEKVSQLKVGKAAANYQVNLQDWTSGTSWQGIWGAQKNCFLPPKGLFQWMPNHCNAMHCISVGQPINWICICICICICIHILGLNAPGGNIHFHGVRAITSLCTKQKLTIWVEKKLSLKFGGCRH